MKKTFIILSTLGFLFFSCHSKKSNHVKRAFYYWKTSFDPPNGFLDTLKVKKLYLRLFDVAYNELKVAVPIASLPYESLNYFPDVVVNEPLPDSLIFEIVPTVYITNYTLEKINKNEIENLSLKISKKINKFISYSTTEEILKWRPKKIKEIQFDCDWTDKTREKYFLLLKYLKAKNPGYKISATIRLYQYKYFEKAGVPPIDRGMLMVYNLTSLKNSKTRNSILDIEELKKYLTHTNYPLKLDIALPLFSWGLIYRDDKYIGIFNKLDKNSVMNLKFLQPYAENQFISKVDTVYENTYLREGDMIKIEEVSDEVLLEAAQLIQPLADKNEVTVSFFHLDYESNKKYNFETLNKIYAVF